MVENRVNMMSMMTKALIISIDYDAKANIIQQRNAQTDINRRLENTYCCASALNIERLQIVDLLTQAWMSILSSFVVTNKS